MTGLWREFMAFHARFDPYFTIRPDGHQYQPVRILQIAFGKPGPAAAFQRLAEAQAGVASLAGHLFGMRV